MQDIASKESEASIGHTYAEPLSGLRISWGALLAGTVATLAVSWIIWALGLAIVSLATSGSWTSIRGSVIALWIIAICTTLVGAFVGAMVGKAQRSLQQARPGEAGTAIGSAARSVVGGMLGLLVAVGWTWWGTWFVSMFLAVLGGAIGATRLVRRAETRRAEPETPRRPMGPLTPAPTP